MRRLQRVVGEVGEEGKKERGKAPPSLMRVDCEMKGGESLGVWHPCRLTVMRTMELLYPVKRYGRGGGQCRQRPAR